jgi:hypothetical protein
MPLISTRGAASAQGFGEFAQSGPVNYIEDVFSTYLYTGNQTARSIVNGIDLSTKGGMVWTKCRSAAGAHAIFDTARGTTGQLNSGSTAAAVAVTDALTAYNTDGYSLGVDNVNGNVNNNGFTFVSWTFRKQAKFFDVVTFTSNGSGGGTFSHSLGSTPGCVIIKSTSAANSWLVYHRSTGVSKYLELQSTAAEQTGTNWISVSSTSVTVDSGWLGNNRSMVAYLFAHDAGGFGLSGSDNVISCGSYTGNGAANGQLINLGYEAQWVMIKQTNASGSGWWMTDTMRGWWVNGSFGSDRSVYANASNAESNQVLGEPDAQGFRPINDNINESGQTYIYIAIRRGPMKTPTSGTSVFSPNAFTPDNVKQTTNFPVDMLMGGYLEAGSNWAATVSRLQGLNTLAASGSPYPRLVTSSTGAELSGTSVYYGYDNTGFISGGLTGGAANIAWSFRRAPGFFDVVCFTATGSNFSVTHNLGAVPELVITKERNGTRSWYTYAAGAGNTKYLALDGTAAATTGNAWQDTTPTSTTLYLTGGSSFFSMSQTYVAYLFATVAGVSKVGSYTGSGTTKQIDCGFTGGARFVLIKRTDSTGDWYVYDSARGIVSGNDPYLLLNSTAAEVTNTDYVDTYSAGFELSSTAPAALNANGGTYIFLAIA